MRSVLQWSQSARGCWSLILLFSLLYLLVYRSIESWSRERDAAIREKQEKIAELAALQNSPERQRTLRIHQLLDTLGESPRESVLRRRIRIDPGFEERMEEEFSLAGYQSFRENKIEHLAERARKLKLDLAAEASGGLPPHQVDEPHPQSQWARLSLSYHLVQTAIEAGIQSVERLEVAPAGTGEEDAELASCRMEMEMVCRSGQLWRLLYMLPMTSDEIRKSLEREDFPDHKPAIFVERILIRKNSDANPDQVRAWIRTVGFYLRPHADS